MPVADITTSRSNEASEGTCILPDTDRILCRLESQAEQAQPAHPQQMKKQKQNKKLRTFPTKQALSVVGKTLSTTAAKRQQNPCHCRSAG